MWHRRSQWPRGLRRRSAAARLVEFKVRIPPGVWMFVCCECCVLSADQSSRGVLPTVVRRCVWSRILVNEAWMTTDSPKDSVRQKQTIFDTAKLAYEDLLDKRVSAIFDPENFPNTPYAFTLLTQVKVNQSRYRPGGAQRVPGSLGSQVTWKQHRM